MVDSEAIEERNVLNVKDALGTIPGVISMSKKNGYDSRLISKGNYVTGMDLAFDYRHGLFGQQANLVFGL